MEMGKNEYAERLVKIQLVWWKRLLNVQKIYQWNIRRLNLGVTLDIGCGIGRNLVSLAGSIGIDIDQSAVNIARSRGFVAYTLEDFEETPYHQPNFFDSFLLAHVAEHLGHDPTIALLRQYLELLKPDGKVVIITPQEAGMKSDPTHVEMIGFTEHQTIVRELGLQMLKTYSYPLPRWLGTIFTYNEFISVSQKSCISLAM